MTSVWRRLVRGLADLARLLGDVAVQRHAASAVSCPDELEGPER